MCTAVETLLHKGKYGEIYNIGSDPSYEKSVMDIARILISIMKNRKLSENEDISAYIEYVDDRPFNDKRYFITNEKLKQLGWHQTIDLEKGIKELFY